MSTVLFVIAMTLLGVFALLTPLAVASAAWNSERATLRMLACWGAFGALSAVAAVAGGIAAVL